jgi:hypothetical protein
VGAAHNRQPGGARAGTGGRARGASLFEVVKADHSAWNNYSMIFVRVGEAGVTMLPFHRDQFLNDRIRGWWRVLPVLALCRIGAAETELIEELKRRYVAVDLRDGGQHDNYKAALFATLLKLGQEPFLETNHPASSPQDAWYAQALATPDRTTACRKHLMFTRRRKWLQASNGPSRAGRLRKVGGSNCGPAN